MGVGAGVFGGILGLGVKNTIANVANMAINKSVDTALSAIEGAYTGGVVHKANTGGRFGVPRFATGGANRVITGDAPGGNIFAGGAKPELVSSNSDITVTPLNKIGSEKKTKIDRMSPDERKNALATGISSHVVKFNYKLPEGLIEVSNEGEAIKVLNVKPGITDTINIGGTETTLADIVASIQAQLQLLVGAANSGNQLLGAIATTSTKSNVQGSNNISNTGNPFAGTFPDSLNSILGGN